MGRVENEIQKDILNWLRVNNFLAWRSNNIPIRGRAFTGLKGVGDILGVLPCSKFLSIEVKTKEGRVSNDQQEFIERVTASGGRAIIARSVLDVISELDKCLTCSKGKSSGSCHCKGGSSCATPCIKK